ncbi:cytoskeleton-associated protein 2 [Brienomyrus brachyistius]|uniref:cytoskeleton-associated protein 2 n=1 Tax=Brienomyrus brachyistius TaxID=42636 RepID=UPI0020B40EF5|nr:cytoskeleton-associated protein 2 [Brienomyrus brachyistius]XP_048857366.1 cytoskeleton-associated protein 2 [Brienomyrus brachyistius]
MDPVMRRKMNTKKDKENTEPATEGNRSTTQPTLKNRKAGVEARGLAKASKKNEGATLRATKTLIEQQNEPRAGPAAQPSNEKRRTISQAFLSQQAVQQKKLVAEVVKPHAAGPPKPIPGTYKGRVVQSKVSSFWKPAGGDSEAEAKGPARPMAPTAAVTKSGNLTRARAMSTAAAVPAKPQVQKMALPPRSKSVPHKPPQPPANKNTGNTIPKPAAPKPQRPAPRLESSSKGPAVGALARPGSSKAPGTLRRKEPILSVKPRPPGVAATEKRAPKPPSASTMSQYRVTTETAEERRAKLSVWLAAKGKTLKRPPAALPTAAISKPATKPHPKPRADSQPQTVAGKPDSNLQLQPMVQPGLDLLPAGESVSDLGSEPERPTSPKPDLLNTTLDLLDSSDLELSVDPEIRMDDLVINLCTAMEAMEVASASDANSGDRGNSEEDVGEDKLDEMEGNREEEDIPVKEECEEELEQDDEVGKEVEGASVLRYSVRTTPYLQSVKRRIQQDATPGSVPRRQSTIKDLKFLTPVRRSCRIQRQSARLPAMLAEHDPCVASLAELARLDDAVGDVSAYIYRHNPALPDDQLYQPKEAGL